MRKIMLIAYVMLALISFSGSAIALPLTGSSSGDFGLGRFADLQGDLSAAFCIPTPGLLPIAPIDICPELRPRRHHCNCCCPHVWDDNIIDLLPRERRGTIIVPPQDWRMEQQAALSTVMDLPVSNKELLRMIDNTDLLMNSIGDFPALILSPPLPPRWAVSAF